MFARRWIKQLLGTSALGLIVVFTATGCGGGPNLIPVSGEVTVNGKPLEKGSLAFRPETGQIKGGDPGGTIENGKYTIFTNGKPGAPAGKYKVGIVAHQEIDSTKPTAVKPLLDPQYNDPEKSVLKVEVVEKASPGAYDFKLK